MDIGDFDTQIQLLSNIGYILTTDEKYYKIET